MTKKNKNPIEKARESKVVKTVAKIAEKLHTLV